MKNLTLALKSFAFAVFFLTSCVSQNSVDTLAGGSASSIVTSGGPAITLRPILLSSPSSSTFGTVTVGSTTPLTFTLTNTGEDTAVIGVLSSTGLYYSITSDNCSLRTLLIAQTCTVTVTYSPLAAAVHNGFITVPYSGSDGTAYTYSQTLNGTATAAQPNISSAPTSWDYGTIATGSTGTKTFIISNSTAGAATFQAATIAGSGYAITADGCNTQVLTNVSGTCNITVTFSPVIPGSMLGTLTLNYKNAANAALTSTVSLSGIGNVPQPVLTLSPSPFNFGNVATNSFGTQIITVANNTSVSAFMGTATISGAGYSITGGNCNGITLGASANCTITIKFTPGSTGAVSGTLTVPFSSAQGINYTATDTLGGTGVTPTVAFAFSGFTGVPATDTSGLTSTGVTLQWTAQNAASYYKITQTTGGVTTVTSALTPTSVATYNKTGLTPNTTYQFKVNAYDTGNVSDGNNNFVTITTPNTTGSTFNGWADIVSYGNVFTDIGSIDDALAYSGVNRLERNISPVSGFDNTQVNTATSRITISNFTAYTNTYNTGDKVMFYATGASTPPSPLVSGTAYYLIKVSSNVYQLATTSANALANTAITLTTAGTGNFTIQPTAQISIAWELFTISPSGSASSYNIYRSTDNVTFTLYGTSSTNTFTDQEVSANTTYYYKVQPVTAGTEVTASNANDTVVQVLVPPDNMIFVHRWMMNREMCTNLLGFAWPAGVDRTNNYSCAYTWGTGYAPSIPAGQKSKWDMGNSLIVDRFPSGCKMTTTGPIKTNGAPAGGANGDVHYWAGAVYNSTAGIGNAGNFSNVGQCSIKSAGTWYASDSGILAIASRAPLTTNRPGYPPYRTSQLAAYSLCQQRSAPGATDGNGNSALRLMRLHEGIALRAFNGNYVNARTGGATALIQAGTNLPLNGSCNQQAGPNAVGDQTDGATPDPQYFPRNLIWFINGSFNTRNCYSRYGMTEISGRAGEMTSDQAFYASGAGNTYFAASTVDPGAKYIENYAFNGALGPNIDTSTNNQWYGAASAASTVPMFGLPAVANSAAIGSRAFAITSGTDNTFYQTFPSTRTVTFMNENGTNTVYNRFGIAPVGASYQGLGYGYIGRCVGQVGP